jgi:uncharacterized protein (DUF1697 family)
MSRLIAFLRAINVGGHTVTMESLRRHFEALGFDDVETFIASGNVIFTSGGRNAGALERKIESRLHAALGFEVRTFVRTDAEVRTIARYQPFAPSEVQSAGAFCVGFLGAPLDPPAKRMLLALQTEDDTLHAHGREVYWLCRTKQSESKFSNALLEKTLNVRATFRGVNTVRKLAEKYGR